MVVVGNNLADNLLREQVSSGEAVSNHTSHVTSLLRRTV